MEDVKYILKEASEDEMSWAYVLHKLQQHRRWIGLFTIISSILVSVIIFQKDDYFTSTAIISSRTFQKNELAPILDRLTKIVTEKSDANIARALTISETQASSINDFTTLSIQEVDGQDYIFEFTVTSTDSNAIPEIFAGVTRFLAANPYLSRRIDEEKLLKNALIEKLEEQIDDLKAFKKETRNLVSSSKEGVMIYPVNIHSELLSLEEQLLNTNAELHEISLIQYIQRPIIPDEASGPNRKLVILGTLIGSFFFSLFIAIGLILFEPKSTT